MRNKLLFASSLVLFGACSVSPRGTAPAPAVVVTEPEIAALATILESEDRRVPEPIGVLDHLASTSPLVRARAAVAVGRLRYAPGIPRLVPLLSDRDTAVAASAAFALGQIGDTTAVAPLAGLLSGTVDPARATVAAEAAYALGKLRSAESRTALRHFLAHAPVGATATDLVARSALLAIWRFPRDAAEDPIGRWLPSRDPEVRWRAAYALVRRPDPAATPRLLGLLDDADPRVRALAARGLTSALADSSGVGAGAARERLIASLDDPEYIVRISGIGALGTHRHGAAVEALAARLASEQPHEALAATEALGRLEGAAAAAAPLLESRIAEAQGRVALRAAALAALARIDPDRAALAALPQASSPEWRMRAAAAAVLAPGGAVEMESLLRDPDGRVATAALQATLQAAGDSLARHRPLLVESLGSPDEGVRIAALGGLRRLGDPSALPLLLEAYAAAEAGPPNDVAPAALAAIAALRGEGRDPARAFFARFSRPADPLVHQLAVTHFGEAALHAWGDPLPLETGRTTREYEGLVRRWVAPSLEGAPAPAMIIQTSAGEIRLRLFPADAPLTVQSFSDLAESGFFDGQEWPRVVPNFVVQGGDPRGDTSGGPGYSLRDEISRHRYATGSLGMALSGPDTGGSQFFITHSPHPHLDGIYAIFGQLSSGGEVTKRILPGDPIQSIRLVHSSN